MQIFATISAENTIDLSFTTRGALGQDKYRLLKSNQPGGVYVAIDSIYTSDTIIHFNDDTPFAWEFIIINFDMLVPWVLQTGRILDRYPVLYPGLGVHGPHGDLLTVQHLQFDPHSTDADLFLGLGHGQDDRT